MRSLIENLNDPKVSKELTDKPSNDSTGATHPNPLEVVRGRRPPTSLTLRKPSLIAYLNELANRLGKETLTCRDVNTDGKININTVIRVFGGFSLALVESGLRPARMYRRNRRMMLKHLAELSAKLGRNPSQWEVKKNLAFSPGSYVAEFGSWRKALKQSERYHSPTPSEPQIDPVSPKLTLDRPTPSRRSQAALDNRESQEANEVTPIHARQPSRSLGIDGADNRRQVFVATVSQCGCRGRKRTVCLTDIRRFGGEVILADHLWLPYDRRWERLEPISPCLKVVLVGRAISYTGTNGTVAFNIDLEKVTTLWNHSRTPALPPECNRHTAGFISAEDSCQPQSVSLEAKQVDKSSPMESGAKPSGQKAGDIKLGASSSSGQAIKCRVENCANHDDFYQVLGLIRFCLTADGSPVPADPQSARLLAAAVLFCETTGNSHMQVLLRVERGPHSLPSVENHAIPDVAR